MRSSRIHILNVSVDPRKPEIAKVVEPEAVIRKTGYSRPHTVHCMPGDIITISMLGDWGGDLPGGFAVLDARTFDVLADWEHAKGDRSWRRYPCSARSPEDRGLGRDGFVVKQPRGRGDCIVRS